MYIRLLVAARLLAWSGSACWLAFLPGSLWAQAPAPAPTVPPPASSHWVRVVEIEGVVEFTPPGRPERWSPCSTNQIIQAGYQVRTGERGRATLRLPDSTPVPLGPSSQLEVFPDPEERTWFSLVKGFLYLFRRGPPSQYKFRTPSVSTVTEGTEFSLAVDSQGTTIVHLFEGRVTMTNASGALVLESGQAARIALGGPPGLTVFHEPGRALQWRLYYPWVLDLAELDPPLNSLPELRSSLEAYARGDLQGALQAYPQSRVPIAAADKIYLASLWLVVGQVEKSEELLKQTETTPDRAGRLTRAIQTLIRVVRSGQAPPLEGPPLLSTEFLANTYAWQSHGDLEAARQAARSAVEIAPGFALAWARLAELEFSFGALKPVSHAIEESLRLAPANAQALALKGFLVAAQSRSPTAEAWFDRALECDPALGNAWLGRGLIRIRQGHVPEGLEDLQTAAALEPQRSLLRSYLGKAFQENGDAIHAAVELDRARELDPADPTPWLYAALMDQDAHRLNEAVRALEQSQRLNDNRYIDRSRLRLDQDRSVRAANLAGLYQDVGMDDVSLRESLRAVGSDYANASAHSFLANSYNQRRDPGQVELRYETAWLSEYLMANLLAPVGGSALSPLVGQNEYSRLFERNRLGFSSLSEYRSNGDWLESASQYGSYGGSEYAVDGIYRSLNGWRRNQDLEDVTLTMRLKQELSPQDTVYMQASYYDAEGGDLTRYYNPAQANPGVHVEENQEPILLAGYHHQWSPGSHTLLLAGYLDDTLRVHNPDDGALIVQRVAGNVARVGLPSASSSDAHYESALDAYTMEGQQIWQNGNHTLAAGLRFQTGQFDIDSEGGPTQALLYGVNGFSFLTANLAAYAHDVTVDLERLTAYSYWTWQFLDPFWLTTGLAYDHLRYPENFRFAPVSDDEKSTSQVSPKAGLVWTPLPDTTVRGFYARSLGGVSLDQSFRLEPTQLGGFNQAFRSVIPESVSGPLTAPEFETWGVGWDQKIGSGTYLGAQAQWLESDVHQDVGLWTYTPIPIQFQTAGTTTERLDYKEQTLLFTLNQLVGNHMALGSSYRLSRADLDQSFPGIPAFNGSTLGSDVQAILHQVHLYALAYSHSGWFGQFDSVWSQQSNQGYAPDIPGDDFWQFNLHVGRRFWRRHAEVRASLLNVADQDYRLNPLNLTAELPRERTLAFSLRLAF